MIYCAEYERTPLGPDLPGDFDHYFEAPAWNWRKGCASRAASTAAILEHVRYYGQANGAHAVTVYVETLGRVGYAAGNCGASRTCVVDRWDITPQRAVAS